MAEPNRLPPGVTRRIFLSSGAKAATSLGLMASAADAAVSEAKPGADAASGRRTITLTVNGKNRTLTVEPRTTLVEALRDTLGMTGTKIGCNQGQCGACTVLVSGRRINSCLMLAMSAESAEIVTIEGLSDRNGELHPMQKAFAEKDAFQCGYCTPGQILSAIACIDEGHAGSAAEIREYMSGNLCRCGAYPNIVAAIESVRDQGKG